MEDILDLIAITEPGAEVVNPDTQVESVVEQTQTEPEVEVVEQEPTQEEQVVDMPTEYEIDGEKYSLDDIREWRKGNMRQSDYTKKTTELANQRKEVQDALEIYEYLMAKPDLVQKLYELDVENPADVKKVQDKLDPVTKQIQELNQKLLIKDIESELKDITSKDKLVTDVELLELANQMKCPISTAYDIWKGKNMDKILKEKELELKRSLTEQIKKDTTVTKTLISPTDTNNDNGNLGLSDEQVAFADKLGMTKEEYKKYMSNPW